MFDKLLNSTQSTKDGAGIDAAQAARLLLTEGGPMDLLADPIALVKKNGEIVAANRAARALTEVIGRRKALAPSVAKALDGNEPVKETLSAATAAEAEAMFEFTVLPLATGAGAIVVGRDVSMERSLRDALVESRRRYKDLVELFQRLCLGNRPGRQVRVRLAGRRDGVRRRRPRLSTGRRSSSIRRSSISARCPSVRGRRCPTSMSGVCARTGESACLLTSAVPISNDGGVWTGTRGVCRDITRARHRDAALALAQTRKQLLAHIIRSVRDEIDPAAMLATAASATAHALGAPYCRIFRLNQKDGFEIAAEFGMPTVDADFETPILDRVRTEMDIVTGIEFDNCVLCVPTIYQKALNGAVLIARDTGAGPWSDEERALAADVSGQLSVAFEQIQNHAQLEVLSRTDELTGLLNRRAFYGELHERLSRSAAGALFFVDLDNFKLVNDTHGHHRGDEALIAVSELLTGFSRPGDLVARFGGDEFALWLERMDGDTVSRRAHDLLGQSRSLSQYSGDPARPLGLSVGVAVHDPDTCTETVTGLTDRADAAMYRIKHDGKGGFVLAEAPEAAQAPAEAVR